LRSRNIERWLVLPAGRETVECPPDGREGGFDLVRIATHDRKHNAVVSCNATIAMTSGKGDDFPGEAEGRKGRFHVPHRDGARVEVGEPIRVGGDRPWMCAVKLVGRRRDVPADGPEATQTLLVGTGRGLSPDDARRAALAQLTLVYGSPVEPPPAPVISQKASDPPPELETDDVAAAEPPKSGVFARFFAALARLFGV
jgi:hypothetical protein